MTFRIKQRQFNNDGAVYTAPVIAKKINGYKVLDPEGNVTFICNSDIDILEMSDDEKHISIEF